MIKVTERTARSTYKLLTQSESGGELMIRLLIIADDFTGGLDTGVQFASRGIPACVLTNPEENFEKAAGECEVLVVVAETRHLPPDKAYGAVFTVARKGMELGAEHLYKKTDSALRGNIGAELTAMANACGVSLLPFIPALPAMNRVTRGGIHYIDNVPVAESVFGRDPFEPVKESNVAQLITLQSSLPAAVAAPGTLDQSRGIAVIDAETDEDLLRAADEIGRIGNLRVSAGCAGFASVLPGLLHLVRRSIPQLPKLDPGLFVLCGSVNPITQRQLDHGEKHGYKRIHIPPQIKLYPEKIRAEEFNPALQEWKQKMETVPWMILDANDADPRNEETAALAKAQGMNVEDIRQRISGSLGLILSSLTESDIPRTMLITGGDTLLTGMNLLKVYQMIPLAEAAPGVVISQVSLHGRPRYVITKSGGFGSETLLSDLKKLIETQSAPEA